MLDDVQLNTKNTKKNTTQRAQGKNTFVSFVKNPSVLCGKKSLSSFTIFKTPHSSDTSEKELHL